METLRRMKGTAVGVPAALIVLFSLCGSVLGAQGHEFAARECAICHEGGQTVEQTPATPPEVDVSSKCVNCHSSCDVWFSHEGRSIDDGKMVETLPLSKTGEVKCVTCHHVHLDRLLDRASRSESHLRISNLKRELCLNCHWAGQEKTGSVDVEIPPANVVVYEDYIPLLGRTSEVKGNYLKVHINGASFPLRVADGIFHTRLKLQEGINVISISVEGSTLWRGEVFQAPSHRAEGYGRIYYNHQTDSLGECFECHREEGGQFTAVTDAAPGLCYNCHEPLDTKRFLHGPLAVGACLSCHDPHGGIGPYHLRDREVKLCLSCHDGEGLERHAGWGKALADGSCSGCHDPHQSDTRFLTREARL